MVDLVWTQQQVETNLDKVVMRNLTRAAMFVEKEVVKSISVGQPVRRLPGGRLIGLRPSFPGEPPHVLRGFLRKSITHKVFKRENQIIAIVGSVMAYARRLEMGFVGVDAAGRSVHQGPRPYLRPAVRNNRERILQFLVGK